MSALTLAIEASTYAATVALARGDALVRATSVPMRDPRQERLMPAVVETLGDVLPREIDSIVCGAGPGSFTSLRIAASIAKGFAVASRKPLVAVSSLVLMIAGMDEPARSVRWLAVLDAMRGESFAQLIDVASNGTIREASALRVMREEELAPFAQESGARIAGPGRAMDVVPNARGIVRLMDHPDLRTPVDLAAWEPNYGRLAEAQVRWEAAHGRALDARAL
ncbi:MAG: tRNA (adenosine(37)-N6)-threonylcarbamoyltransferase complex dimerization subunit type 1 TsaB [Gemmatimonadaceae bacterium]